MRVRDLIPHGRDAPREVGPLLDQEVDVSDIERDAQLLVAEAAARRLLNRAARDLEGRLPFHSLKAAAHWGSHFGVITRTEMKQLLDLHRAAGEAYNRRW